MKPSRAKLKIRYATSSLLGRRPASEIARLDELALRTLIPAEPRREPLDVTMQQLAHLGSWSTGLAYLRSLLTACADRKDKGS